MICTACAAGSRILRRKLMLSLVSGVKAINAKCIFLSATTLMAHEVYMFNAQRLNKMLQDVATRAAAVRLCIRSSGISQTAILHGQGAFPVPVDRTRHSRYFPSFGLSYACAENTRLHPFAAEPISRRVLYTVRVPYTRCPLLSNIRCHFRQRPAHVTWNHFLYLFVYFGRKGWNRILCSPKILRHLFSCDCAKGGA